MELDAATLANLGYYFRTRPVLKAWLFGSYAIGKADAESDVDILVDLDYSQRIGLKFVQMQIDLEKMLRTKVDLVSSNGISVHLKPIIDQEKKLIYAR
jgi:predicted nucleotidyltransferase